jgi:hypothetical protein
LLRHGEAKRARAVCQSQGAGSIGTKDESQAETAADISGRQDQAEQAGFTSHHTIAMSNTDSLQALEKKIARVLAIKPECVITHPSELHVLRGLSQDELRRFGRNHGWRTIRRLGGSQIDFYNDVSVRGSEQTGRYGNG